MAIKEKANSEEFDWTAEHEIQLFSALDGLNPFGINRHFNMLCISEKLSKHVNREVPSETIWPHLRTLFNLDLLDEQERLPFPNHEKDFILPDTDYGSLKTKKRTEATEEKKPETVKPDSVKKERNSSQGSVSKHLPKDLAKIIITERDAPKRTTPKRTRGSMSIESNSPSTTPPPIQSNKRRRI